VRLLALLGRLGPGTRGLSLGFLVKPGSPDVKPGSPDVKPGSPDVKPGSPDQTCLTMDVRGVWHLHHGEDGTIEDGTIRRRGIAAVTASSAQA
jgi:hypothetical protein